MTATTEPAPAPAASEPTPQPMAARVSWALVPQVNLLPPEVLANRRFRMLQRQLLAVMIAVLALCGISTLWAGSGVGEAQDDLSAAQAQSARLAAEQNKYSGLPVVLGELDRVKTAREAALGADVAWYRFLSDLAINTPDGAELSSVIVTMDGSATPSASSVPLLPAGLGQVKIVGKALAYTDVASWLESVNRVHGIAGSSLDVAAKGQGSTPQPDDAAAPPTTPSTGSTAVKVDFTGKAVIVPAALSHRYDRKAS